MTALDRHSPAPAASNVHTDPQVFDEQWLRGVNWTLLQDHGALVWWRVRSPMATRSWLVLRPRAGAGESQWRRLDREMQFGRYLQADWAVTPVTTLHTATGPVLVVDDHDGRPLSELTDGKISIGRFLRLATAMASTLSHAHTQGIIHRDIKPAHFLMCGDNRLRLSSFTLAVHSELPLPIDADAISGSLPYMSPEQGGRLNQVADQRSDLYSLGVTFYELLTGHLPLHAEDPAQWLHQHVAVPPLPLTAYRRDLPCALQRLIDRLLAKSAAERFPSAAALAAQLRQALSEWSEYGHINELAGEEDSDKLFSAQAQLYGRDAAYGELLAAAQSLRLGQPGGVFWIDGPAGMGKTALVRQLRAELAGSPIMFGNGKFEAGLPRSPYAALSSVLTSLLARVVGDEPGEVARCTSRLSAALGSNGSLLARLVPELEWITGPLPASNESVAAEGRRRLLDLFLRALKALSSAERPVIVFFDDLQWIDNESLVFFQSLRAEDFQHMLLIGACRSDASSSVVGKAFARSLALPLRELHLQPLTAADVLAMVNASLRLGGSAARRLVKRLQRQGEGNPLFVSQALQAFKEYPPQDIDEQLVAGDVVEVMSARLARLPSATRSVLGRMALLGSHAQREALAVACALPAVALEEILSPAVNARLIRENHDGLLFCHDHVQEAAKRLLPASSLGAEHHQIALRLIAGLQPEASAERLFQTAAQVLQAHGHASDDVERQAFVALLMRAAYQAKDAAAAPFALDYIEHAQQLLAVQGSTADPAQVYELAFLRAQCLILNTQYALADEQIAALLGWVADSAALTSLYLLKSEILLLAGDYVGAVGAAVEALGCLGLQVDVEPSDETAEQAWDEVTTLLGGRSIESLSQLPAAEDARIAKLVELLTTVGIIGCFVHRNLMFVLLCHGVRLSLQHGVTPASSRTFAWFGVSSAHRNDSHAQGFEWAQMALRLVDERGYHDRRPSVLLALDRISAWSRPLPFALGCAEQALRTSLSRDTPIMGCYANNHIVSDLLVMGAPIERTLRQIDTGLTLAQNLEFVDSRNILFIQALYIRRLAGYSSGTMTVPDREEMAQRIAVSPIGPAHFWWHLFEGLFYYLEGEFARASAEMDMAWDLSWAAPAHIHLIDLAMFSVLNSAARLDGSSIAAAAVERPMERLHYLASLNPDAFGDRLDLARAELMRAQGKTIEAMQLYDQAVAKATGCGAVHIQGLAHELASRCHQALGLTVSTRAHLSKARDAWRQWGAHALAEQLEAQHPYLQEQAIGVRSGVDVPGGQPQLDMMSITKACQALSRELEVEQLLRTLLANTIVHAGANHAILLLTDGDNLNVEAIGHAGPDGVQISLMSHAPQAEQLPISLVRTAMRSRRSIVIENARYPERFVDDPYLRTRRTGSLLCVPLLKQNEIIGVMYLENLLVAGVFVPARIDVLEVLAAHAAISLTTARLYGDLLEESRRRRDSESRLRTSRAALAIGQAVSRQSTFIWNPALEPSFCSAELLAQLELTAPEAGQENHDPITAQLHRQPLHERVHAEDIERFERTLDDAVSANHPFRLEFRVYAAQGEIRHLEALAEPDEQGSYIGIVFDVTERHRTEAALRSARAEMAQISQRTVLAELAASIAHEVNQPLLSILANASASLRWLERDVPALDDAANSVRDILTDGRRAADIVSALHSLARQEPMRGQPVALDALVRRVVELTRTELDNQQVGVSVVVDSLPDVHGDPVQLQQVVLNLISNAMDAMRELEPTQRLLRLEMCAVAQGVVLMVEDTGPGFADADEAHIFQAFYSTKTSGMGMGLAICKSIVEAHGGRLLAMQGRAGETVFAMVLPAIA
jgi:predicted ATPase/signal transduction histidine kinase/GAF domain-containing protein